MLILARKPHSYPHAYYKHIILSLWTHVFSFLTFSSITCTCIPVLKKSLKANSSSRMRSFFQFSSRSPSFQLTVSESTTPRLEGWVEFSGLAVLGTDSLKKWRKNKFRFNLLSLLVWLAIKTIQEDISPQFNVI